MTSWRTHAVTGRSHAFSRSPHVADCGLTVSTDCPQELLPNVDRRTEKVRTDLGELDVIVPHGACGLCRRGVRARTRRTAGEGARRMTS